MSDVEDFKRVFGDLKIIKNKECISMEITKKVQSAGRTIKQVKGENKSYWYIWDFDENCYSTFNDTAGKIIEGLKTGQAVQIKYTQKGAFRNIDEVIPVEDVNADIKQGTVPILEKSTAEEIVPPVAQSLDEKTADIHRQVAWKIAGAGWGWFDLVGKDEKERMKLLSGFAQTVEKILNGEE